MGRRARFGTRTAGIGLAVFALICRSATADTSVAFNLAAGRSVVVPVLVNNQGPFEFLLDTGTNTTVVDTQLARQLGLRAKDRVSLISLLSVRAVPRARLQTLTLGPKVVGDLDALCADLGAIRRRAGSVRGVVGQQFLSRFKYLLSYDERRLEFFDGDAAEPPLRGVRLPFDSDEGRIVVVASAATNASPDGRRFVLDSGTSHLVLFDRPGRWPGMDVEVGHGTAVASTSHTGMLVRTGRIRSLAVGGQTFHDLPVIMMPEASRVLARVEDGLLPTNLFRSVYFDHRERFVLLNPLRRRSNSSRGTETAAQPDGPASLGRLEGRWRP